MLTFHTYVALHLPLTTVCWPFEFRL